MNWQMVFLLVAVALFGIQGIRAAMARVFDLVTWGLFAFALAFLVPHLARTF